ncbi:serine hydrolase [Streptomyces niveus]|uniref:serine hydrolase n=1 Tax=Streptomyces niveus TaxID=193462 RepID=UPI00369897AA
MFTALRPGGAAPSAEPEAVPAPSTGADSGTAADAAPGAGDEPKSAPGSADQADAAPAADGAPKSALGSAEPDAAPAPASARSEALPASSATADEPGAGSEAAADPSAGADSGTAAGDASKSVPGSAEPEADPVRSEVLPAASAPAAGPDAAQAAGDAPKSAPGSAESDAAPVTGGTSDEPGVDRKTAVFKALRPEAKADSRTAADAAPKSATGSAEPEASAPAAGSDAAQAAGSATKSAPGSAESDAGPADEPGVDRKTAVFKALKPGGAAPSAGSEAGPEDDAAPVDRKTAVLKALDSAPAGSEDGAATGGVDQPTAMLKLPPQPAELPAERTSKFVPLRADEVRAPAQPAGSPVVEAERTRQQPMPPLPPLDLLAELTNKPAPPETPTRTVVRRVKIWTPLLVLALIIFAVVQAVRPLPTPSLKLTANSAYTFEGDKPALPWPGEGQGFMAATGLGTVDSFGEQKAVPIGSVAKAMTAYVVLKDKPLKKGAQGPSITVDAKAEEDGGLDAQGESTLNTVKEGDKLTQHDALAALMIPSANNIARLLARWDTGGSEEEFVKKMNDTAAELGMKNTKYTDPSGLDATTVSSAEDQVKLGQELVEIEALMDITKLPEWTDPSGKTWRNYNTLVPYDGALGIKTGSTTKAGGNLLFAAHKMVGDTDQLIVGAILGQHQAPIIDTVNAASKEVMRATQDELDGATIVKKGQVVGEVDNGLGTKVPLVAVEDVKAVGWSGLTVKLELTDGAKSVPQSAAAGTHIGTLTVGEGKSQVEVAVALQSDLAEASFLDKLTRVG